MTGNVTGNVTGDLTGNADTATAWETARDLSLTGQATGTISSVDGTGNVSGAVTLDNNSVTSKVLTGLTSPSASSVLATDTIVEGFGKLQSQVNGLAGGLRFMGSWDADTNSPVLSSGGGEAANGTTTATTANKLVDSSASFTSTVTVGDQVVNQVDGQTALVSNVDSDTTLSLDADIMLTGEAYTIDNSPFITQGHYYVVSVGGTTTLNGVSNWTVGDWVIAGANNQWTKLDHSQVDGTGTTGNLTKWSSTSVISDSIVSESGTAITVDGSLTTNTNLSSTGDFAVNTNKFTVAAASGDTAFTGDLAINTDKFTVNATTGNTLVAGTLNTGVITGTSANLTTSGTVLSLDRTGGATALVELKIGGTVEGYLGATSTKSLVVFNESASEKFSVSNAGDGTFAGDVIQNSASKSLKYWRRLWTDANNDWGLNNNAGSAVISVSGMGTPSTSSTTFAGSVNVTSGASLGSGLQVARTGHPSLSIITGGTSNAYIGIAPSGGTYVDAITISDTGNSTFAGNVTISQPTNGSDAILSLISKSAAGNSRTSTIEYDADNEYMYFKNAGTTVATMTSGGNVGIGTDSPEQKLHVEGASITVNRGNDDSSIAFQNSTSNATWRIGRDYSNSEALTFAYSATDYPSLTGNGLIYINTSGNVGIGTDSPARGLTIDKSNANAALEIIKNNTGNQIVYLGTGSSGGTDDPLLRMYHNTTENIRLYTTGDSWINGGNLGIGTTSPDQTGYGYKTLTVMGGANAGDSGVLELLAPSVNAENQNYGIVSFGAGGTRTAMISANRQAANNAANLRFWTAAGGAGIQERMRIDKDGQVMIRRTTDYSTDKYLLQVGDGSVDDNIPAVFTVASTSARNQIVFSNNNNNLVGTIITSGSSTSYNTSSDYRLKEDLKDFNGLEKISDIKVYNFKWKDNDNYDEYSKRGYGVIAHELEKVLPQAVNGEKDAEEMQSVDYSKIVPLLVKSIQELKAEVDQLKQECKCKN